MSTLTDKTCKDTVWITPPHIIGAVKDYFGGCIDLDPATEANNPTGAAQIITADRDGLSFDWRKFARAGRQSARVFVNPPYGKELRDWCAKIHHMSAAGSGSWGAEIIALLPGQRFEQAYWQRHVFSHRLAAFCMVRSRLSFLRPDGSKARGNPYGSFIYLYREEENEMAVAQFCQIFSDVGTCVVPSDIHHHEDAR